MQQTSTNRQPPKTPRVRTLHDVGATREIVPYFLDGDHDVIREKNAQGLLNDLYGNEEYFAVAVGHLKLNHYLDFERGYSEPLEMFVNRLLYMFWALSKIANPKLDDQPVPELKMEDGKTNTPYGPMYGSMEANLIDFFAWALSRYGRIVGVDENHKYIYTNVEPAEIVTLLDPKSLLMLDEEGNPLFFEILELTGIFSFKDALAKARLMRGDAAKDDDKGNLALPSNDTGSTNRRRRSEKAGAG